MKITNELLLNRTFNLGKVLGMFNKATHEVLFLVDDYDKLITIVTEADVRQLLLSGCTMDSELGEFIDNLPKKKSLRASSVLEADQLMTEHDIDHIPLIDENERPLQLISKREATHIYLSAPHMGDYEQQFVQDAFDSNWVAPLGPNVDLFEKEVASYININSAVALNSGTSALHLAMILLNVQPGDIVFSSSFTFVATVNPIVYQGATPVFIDSDLETWNMSPVALERALKDAKANNKLPKAVIIVNLYGQSANYDALCQLCDDYNVPIVEDAAESLGATYKNKHSGTFGKLGVFSFNGNKIITTSCGGMLVSDDETLIQKARFLATQARDPAPYYLHTSIGYNYRMSNVLAGIGRGQLKVLEQRVASRRAIFNQYKEAFKSVHFIEMMPEISNGYTTHWLTTMLINPELTSIRPEKVIERLKACNIEARRTWKPMHTQPVFSGSGYYPHSESFSVSDYLFNYGICLPSGSNMQQEDIDRVISSLMDIFITSRNRIDYATV